MLAGPMKPWMTTPGPWMPAPGETRGLMPQWGNRFGNYAGMPGNRRQQISADAAGSIFAPGQRMRLNLVAICVNAFFPWLLFSFLSGLLSFNFHYYQPMASVVISCLSFVVPLVIGFTAWWKRIHEDEPLWYTFAALASFVAVCAALVFGDMNFWINMNPYYDLELLNSYPSVNPSYDVGQQFMDAGKMYFVNGARLDPHKAIGFRNGDMYCVAPVVSPNLQSFDFWAVGVNCCNGLKKADFKCGQYNNPRARSGVRLIDESQRPFFRLAVQQAEAAYNIKAEHPVFFHWVQDPVAEVNHYRDSGFKFYWMAIMSYFVFNSFCVVSASVCFGKIARSGKMAMI